MPEANGAARRRLSLWDCLGVGLNSVIGSGIYLLIAPMAAAAGAASVTGILACAALCSLIALCFAELGAMHDQDGGSYVYARHAQYVPTCLAVVVLRRTAPDVPRPVRLPLGPAIPL